MQGLPTLPLPLGHPWPLPAQQQQQQPSTSPSHMSGLIQAASQLGLPLPGRSCQVAGMKPSSAPGSICMLLSDNASNGSGSRSSPDKSSEARDRSSAEKTAQEGEDEYRRMRRRLTNRESAQRVRHKGKESLQTAVTQARVLAEENCRLQQSQSQSAALVQQLQGELSQWRSTAQAFASDNQQLKRRLTDCEQELEVARKRAFSVPSCSSLELPGSGALPCSQLSSHSFMLAGLTAAPNIPQISLLPQGPQEQVSASACDPFISSLGLPALGQPATSALDLTLDVGLSKELSAPFEDWGDILQHDFPL